MDTYFFHSRNLEYITVCYCFSIILISTVVDTTILAAVAAYKFKTFSKPLRRLTSLLVNQDKKIEDVSCALSLITTYYLCGQGFASIFTQTAEIRAWLNHGLFSIILI